MAEAKNSFNRVAKKGATALLALTLASGAALQASPAFAQGAPQAATAFNAVSAPDDLRSYIEDPSPDLRAIKAGIAATPMGAAILRYARDNNVRFVLDPAITKRGSALEYEPSNGTILVAPGRPLEATIMRAVHEIRHAWQDKTLGAYELERGVLTPWQRWTLRRYMEADAESFAAYFEANRLHQGVPMKGGYAEAMPGAMAVMPLQGQYFTPEGLTFGKYRTLAFEPLLGRLSKYDEKQMAQVEGMTRDFARKAEEVANNPAKRAALQAEVRKAPGDSAFAAFLRRFGGVTLDSGGHTALESKAVTDDMLLRDYPRRELGAGRSYLPELDRKISELDKVYQGALQSLGAATKAQPRPGA